MSLETGTYISDLNSSNPASGDAKSQGDDHLRLLKSTIKATFPNVTGAVTATHTQLNSAATNVLTSGTATATTSGTSIDYTSIPSWVQRITINLSAMSTNGTDRPLIQIGDSGGIETSGYSVVTTAGSNGASPTVTAWTNGFVIDSGSASASISGSMVLTLLEASSFTWVCSGNFSSSAGSVSYFLVSGKKSTSAALDRVRLTTTSGVNTFDAGSVNIQYE